MEKKRAAAAKKAAEKQKEDAEKEKAARKEADKKKKDAEAKALKKKEDAKKEIEKKLEAIKNAGGEKHDKEKKKPKKEATVTYVPVRKDKLNHMFSTPPEKIRRTGSQAESSISGSRKAAEESLQQLESILEDSGSEDASNHDFSGLLGEDADGEQDGEAEGEEAKDEEEKEAEGEEAKDQEEKEAEEEDGEAAEEDGEAEEEEEGEAEEEESDEEEDEEEAEEEDGEAEEEDGEAEEEGSAEEEDGEGAEEEENEEAEDDIDGEAWTGKETEEDTSKLTVPLLPKSTHALVQVTKETEGKVVALRDSSTNKKEWDVFTRKLKSGSNLPVELSEYAVNLTKKKELFNMWLEADQDWEETQVTLERKLTQKNQAKRGWTAVQGKELKKRFENKPEKAQVIMESRKASGLYYEDTDFPGDPDEPRLSRTFVSTFSVYTRYSCIAISNFDRSFASGNLVLHEGRQHFQSDR